MIDLEWHDFLKIGVDFIDEDHRKILGIMLQVKNAINVKNFNECSLLLGILIDEARDHFKREEEYLFETRYPQLENHKIYHNELIIKAEATKAICEGINTQHDAEECFESMANFLIDDILRGDISFKSYLEHKGYIK